MTGVRTLIVGSGFVGTGIARRLVATGDTVTLVSRGRPVDAPERYGARWSALDATDPEACDGLVAQLRPRRIVLVHGPSDVTWCEANAAEADAAHSAVVANFARVGGSSRVIMISTDNVFDGSSPDNAEHTPVSPANAYGRAKRHAEELLLAEAADAVALRVSLVYGHEPVDAGKWLNFFAACAHRLRDGQPVEAPDDHWTTPVHVDDVAEVVAALLTTGEPLPPVLHLGGPDRVTRAEWATVIARALGIQGDLVIPVPKARSRYASRPRNACLTSGLLSELVATRGIPIRGVGEGARDLVSAFASP
ncbi:sugar nucleotide-binding protein [Streptomyces sp. NPDC048441]|uniref:sugar nucleotide-binding protein n=1 Tax=Streptomyces sp. NPDC048441 TaxID=3365552 RepID=UPI003713DA24